MFGPREVLLTSDEPVVRQFLNGRRIGPIGTSEEKDEAKMAEEQAMVDAGHHDGGVRRSRRAAADHRDSGYAGRQRSTPGEPGPRIMHTPPPAAEEAIRDDLESGAQYRAGDETLEGCSADWLSTVITTRATKSSSSSVGCHGAVRRWCSRSSVPTYLIESPSYLVSPRWPAQMPIPGRPAGMVFRGYHDSPWPRP